MCAWPREAATEPYAPGDLLDDLRARFGIPSEAFDGCRFWRRDSGSIWVSDAATVLPDERVEGVGVQVMRREPPRGQPSSAFLRRFGSWIRDGRYPIDAEEAVAFFARGTIPVPPETASRVWAVTCDGVVLGRGRTRDGVLHSELPKASQRLLAGPIW